MFWVGVKVLFFRQIYGMKHRWIMAVCTVVYTALTLALIPLFSRANQPADGMNDDVHYNERVTFGDLRIGGIPNPLLVVAVPRDPKTQRLIFKAYDNLERKYRNFTLFNVHVTFMDDSQRMSLAQEMWPSVGVKFHEISKTKLEYYFYPVMAPMLSSAQKEEEISALTGLKKFTAGMVLSSMQVDGNVDFARGLLELQTAIDAAYIQTYFPDLEQLQIRSFPSFDGEIQRVVDQDKVARVIVAGILVALSLLLAMSMLASYIIRDKMSGVRELLCINGLPRWMVNSSWLISFILLGLIIALLQLIMIKLPPNSPSIEYMSLPLLFVVLVVYGWTALVFACFVANVFTSQLIAILLLLLYWLVTTLAGFLLIGPGGVLQKHFLVQGIISILPNFGFTIILMVLLALNEKGTELSFGNLYLSPNMYISAGSVLFMMLIGIFIFLALALYLDAVKPGPYGRARPWYLFRGKDQLTKVHPDALSKEDDRFFEKTNNGNDGFGLNCVNIVKVFGTYKALNNVNLKIIKNKVTVLLGHNGAGKTTLFSILCGMVSPTSGNVYTEEYSVFNGDNIRKFRSVLGYCPQENLVLNELSVQEHLIIFGLLKGLTRSEALQCSNKWTQLFDMYSLRHTQAMNLSGGTKRKLCLAIAMTGKPQYLLLDEPSAGMDIESTRTMMDVILNEKGSCTVVITTHNMDEADILADYIAILANGQLKCFGTSLFLKKALDSGYRLNCSAIDKNAEQVVKWVDRHIRGASVLYKTNRSVTFSLPASQKSNIPDLLRGLENQFGDAVSSSLSLGTLDDVFIKIQKDEGVNINVEDVLTVQEDEMHRSCWNFSELFMKRVKWVLSKRMVPMIILVILLPNLATVGGIWSIYEFIRDRSEPATPDINTPGEHGGMFALLSNLHDDISESVRSALSNNGIMFKETSEGMDNSLNDMEQTNTFEYRSKLLFAFDTRESGGPTAYLPSWTDDSVSMAYSALINALLRGNATIITHLVPLWNPSNFKDKIRCPAQPREFVGTIFLVIAGPFFLVASAYFVVFPHEERTTLFKHLQLMTGLLPAAYWLVNLLFDFLIYLCCCLIVLIIIASMDHMINIFLEPTVFSAFTVSLILYALSSILLSYIVSFFFRHTALPIIVLILFTILISAAFNVLSVQEILSFKWSFFLPWPILCNAIHKILIWATLKRDCDKCQFYCDSLTKKPLFAELKVEFISFVFLILVYFLILLFLDHGLGKKLKGLIQRLCFGKIKIPRREIDPEVALEKQRVDLLKTEGDWPELVCDGLGKKYSSKKTAVYDVTFTAQRGECFGLVGVNGAGKSTTFGMLSALLSPTTGTAIIEGHWQATGCNYNYLKRVGYCPQTGGLLRELPARTIIKLFGRLNGVRRSQIGSLADKWITALDMEDIAKRPCGHYSGGNKRKLSLAVALIGNPPVVLLDEPTAGVDPVVRRKIWEILTSNLEHHQRTIILTSHTMSECEAICDRLTIMVKGVMKCLGPIPVLKKTFGKSCILEVKFTTSATPNQQNAVRSKIESQFAGYIQLQDIQTSRIVFSLKTENVKIYDLFAAMLKIQSENAFIEDFNMSETPLEQVFFMFAQMK